MRVFFIATEFELGNIVNYIEKIEQRLFCLDKENYIFVTGIGQNEVILSCKKFLNKYSNQLNQIINIGIAGAVNQKLKKFAIYEIGSVTNGNKTYNVGLGKNLQTVIEGVWQENKRQQLYKEGIDLVDMEVFFILELLNYKIPIKIIKVVSDFCFKEDQEEFYQNTKIAIKQIEKVIKNYDEIYN